MSMRALVHVVLCALFIFSTSSCVKKEDNAATGSKKLIVVTTLFPTFDLARNIGGDHAAVTLLLPPGVEAHGFEPKPEDIVKINKADIFIYTGKYMEPWAESILKGIDNKKLIIIDASTGISFLHEVEEHHHEADKHGHDEEMDPHIWLDFQNVQKMADTILEGYKRADATGKDLYTANAERYKAKLSELDNKFKTGLSGCKTRVFIHGGHFAFGYLAKHYNLQYHAAYEGFSPNAEPAPKRLMELVRNMKKHESKAVFYEELLSPKVAETIARETGAALLPLHAAHNLSKDELDGGATFISLMERNLKNLETGLRCK